MKGFHDALKVCHGSSNAPPSQDEARSGGGKAVVRRVLNQAFAVVIEFALLPPALFRPVSIAEGIVAEDEQAHFQDATGAQTVFRAGEQLPGDAVTAPVFGDGEVVEGRAAAVFTAEQGGDDGAACKGDVAQFWIALKEGGERGGFVGSVQGKAGNGAPRRRGCPPPAWCDR